MGFSKYLYAATIWLLFISGTAAQYERPLDFIYALQFGKPLPYSDDQFFQYFDQVQPGITSLVSFLLNVDDISKYESFIKAVQQKNITMVPAVGAGSQDDISGTQYQNIAKVYKTFTDYIRLEVGTTSNIPEIQKMVNYCLSLGFKHIMMNPWPMEKGGAAVNFPNPEVDSAYIQVLLDENKSTEEPIPSSTNWYPGNKNRIAAVRKIRPDASIIINYESAPQQDALTNIEKSKAGSSIAAMQITVDQIKGDYAPYKLHWIPPMDKAYDPIALKTWTWIASQLSKM